VNRVIKTLSVIILLSTIGGCNNKKKINETSQILKPNIIYILADDLGYGDLSFTGQVKFSTPNIDKLSKDGIFFNQHYSGSTVCAPSCSSLRYGKETSFTKLKGHRLHFLSGNLKQNSDCYALERNNDYGTKNRIYL
jgi:arylsulfatase A